jgi:hypothetical protein
MERGQTEPDPQARSLRRAVLIGALGAMAWWTCAAAVQAKDHKHPATATKPPAAPQTAESAILYEEDPSNSTGQRFIGTAAWSVTHEKPKAGSSGADQTVLHADISIPERKLRMAWSMRVNTDASLPASHMVEMLFSVPPGFPPGGIQNVPGMLMKAGETVRGAPLAATSVKVTNGYYMIGLSGVARERAANMRLLYDRDWIDVPIVYLNGRRAILAFEKGVSGAKAFGEAFAAWHEPAPAPAGDNTVTRSPARAEIDQPPRGRPQ